jgi:hypothetical protein
MTRPAFLFAALGCAAAAVALTPSDASACGGAFSPPPADPQDPETITIAAQRMALSISPTQTVLWSQIQYEGPPSEFAWVLPVAPGATIELASPAWFDALDAVTTTHVVPPGVCSAGETYEGSSGGCGLGCGSAAGAPDRGFQGVPNEQTSVEVVSMGTLGPYETVTLSSQNGEAVKDWLVNHGYAVPNDVAPILDAYTTQGMDFMALRLKAGAETGQMQPVRVAMKGASPTIPFRMMVAGAREAVPITLFVIGEGRYAPQSYPKASLDPKTITWNFESAQSDYNDARIAALAASEGGRGFLTTFALNGGLHNDIQDHNSEAVTFRAPSPEGEVTAYSVASLYFELVDIGGPLSMEDCSSIAGLLELQAGYTVEDCEPGMCGSTETPASGFVCGEAKDIAIALTGMRPSLVWLTRLEANVPRQGLTADLTLEPATPQDVASSWVVAEEHENCDSVIRTASFIPLKRAPHGSVWATAVAAAFGASVLRRRPRARAQAR